MTSDKKVFSHSVQFLESNQESVLNTETDHCDFTGLSQKP